MRESFGAAAMLEELAASVPAGGAPRMHVGWGSFRNLDIAAARRSGYAVLLDINEHQFAVWRAVRKAVDQATNASGFTDAVVPLLPTRHRCASASLPRPNGCRWTSSGPAAGWTPGIPKASRTCATFREGRIEEFALDMRGTSHDGADLFGEFAGRLRQGCCLPFGEPAYRSRKRRHGVYR